MRIPLLPWLLPTRTGVSIPSRNFSPNFWMARFRSLLLLLLPALLPHPLLQGSLLLVRLLLLRLLLVRPAHVLPLLLRLLFLALRGPLLRSLSTLNWVRAVLLRPAPLARFSSQRPFVSLPGPRCLRRTRTESAWRRRPVTGLVPSVLTSSPGPVMGSGSDIGSGSIGTFSSTAGQVLYQFSLICSVSLTDFFCPVARFLAG